MVIPTAFRDRFMPVRERRLVLPPGQPRPEIHKQQPPKKKQPPRKRVTIAAGFKFDGGVLLCADTKITSAVKGNETKLLYRSYGLGECATAFGVAAADFDFAKAAVESCQNTIASFNFADARVTIEAVREAIRVSLVNFYGDHIFPQPSGEEVSGFDLVIGVWLRGHTSLFASSKTVINPVNDYMCVGSGGYLGRYWVQKFMQANRDRGPLTLRDTAMLANYMIQTAIDYDESCGGEPELLIMKDTGEIEESCDTVIYPGWLLHQLQSEMLRLIHDLACVTGDMKAETGRVFEDFFQRLRELNASYEYWFDRQKHQD